MILQKHCKKLVKLVKLVFSRPSSRQPSPRLDGWLGNTSLTSFTSFLQCFCKVLLKTSFLQYFYSKQVKTIGKTGFSNDIAKTL